MKFKRQCSKLRTTCFSNLLHTHRISKGLSYKTFGELIGFSSTRAFDFEHDELPEIVDTVDDMAMVLKLTDECRQQLTTAYSCGVLATTRMMKTCRKCPCDDSGRT